MVVSFWIGVTGKYCHANNIGYAARKYEDWKKNTIANEMAADIPSGII